MITWTQITDSNDQLNYGAEYLFRFEVEGTPVYEIGYYEGESTDGAEYRFKHPSNVVIETPATHFTTLNEPA